MGNKEYKFSLILGRFNHIHLGHKMLIDESIKKVEKTLVLIGSMQESGTLRNPFSYDTRKRLIEKIYRDETSIIIAGLEDMSNEHDISFDWGRYILDNVYKISGQKPDIMFYGNDESRLGWFAKEDIEGIHEEVVSRDIFKVSATYLRGLIITNNKEEWKKYVHENIFDEFENLRNELINIDVYKEILSKVTNKNDVEEFLSVYKEYERIDKENKIKGKK